MNTMIGHIIAFLAGSVTGAAGKYFADKFTDQRHQQEAETEMRRRFADAKAKMPELIEEMKCDITKPQQSCMREFFISKKAYTLNTSAPSFICPRLQGYA